MLLLRLPILFLVVWFGRTRIATQETAACYQTDDQIRSPFASMYDQVIINCLSVTASGSVNNVVLSAFNSSNNVTARFNMTCVGSVLVSLPSPLNASRGMESCSASCEDDEEPCSKTCDPVCARCVGPAPSSCTSCASAKLANGTCVASCPYPNQQPNPNMDMLCQCTGLYSGSTCQDCTDCALYGQPDVNCTIFTCSAGPACIVAIAFPPICVALILLCTFVHVYCKHSRSCKCGNSTNGYLTLPTPPSGVKEGLVVIYSEATLENARYSKGSLPRKDHPNEDRHFVTMGYGTAMFAVLDGHDGDRGVVHTLGAFQERSSQVDSHCHQDGDMASFLIKMFRDAEDDLFDKLKDSIQEWESLQAKITPGMKSYQACQQYPREVARLAELEPLISGGCTAVVAVVCGNKLYVANVGDSSAVVVYQTPNGSLETCQLSTDHDVKNEDELKRLEQLGLDPEKLKRAGRLGPQENTRSIGDYNIKEGYRSVDILSHASGPPGTAEPSVITVDIEESFLYLMVMSDGVYKSIEAAVDEAQTIGANQVLANMVHTSAQTPGVEFSSIAQSTLDQVAHLHEEAFQRSANDNLKRRDDMTLALCKFCFKDIERHLVQYHCTERRHWVEESFQLINAVPQTKTSSEYALERKSSYIKRIGTMAEAGSRSIIDITANLLAKKDTDSSGFSAGTLINATYSSITYPKSDNENEDRSLHIDDETFKILLVLDGHRGSSCVTKVCDYIAHFFASKNWKKIISKGNDQHILLKLKELTKETDLEFLEHIQHYIDEITTLKSRIPHDIAMSYEAYQQYPREVARLEELEPLIAGGCTAVVAVVCGNKLYVANVGVSRAVVICHTPNGTLEARQLSTDHDVKNEDELKRLEQLGLDPEELKRAGRLGPQENTRSIGDYNIKGGYKSVDILSHATGPPSTAEAAVVITDIEESFLYLMVMSDGVYKSIEAAVDEAQTIGANQVLAHMVHASAQARGVEFCSIAQTVLDQVAHLHEEAFQRSPEEGPQAMACRKRDDMTLLVYRFQSK